MICTRCGVDKELDGFEMHQTRCKDCDKVVRIVCQAILNDEVDLWKKYLQADKKRIAAQEKGLTKS